MTLCGIRLRGSWHSWHGAPPRPRHHGPARACCGTEALPGPCIDTRLQFSVHCDLLKPAAGPLVRPPPRPRCLLRHAALCQWHALLRRFAEADKGLPSLPLLISQGIALPPLLISQGIALPPLLISEGIAVPPLLTLQGIALLPLLISQWMAVWLASPCAVSRRDKLTRVKQSAGLETAGATRPIWGSTGGASG